MPIQAQNASLLQNTQQQEQLVEGERIVDQEEKEEMHRDRRAQREQSREAAIQGESNEIELRRRVPTQAEIEQPRAAVASIVIIQTLTRMAHLLGTPLSLNDNFNLLYGQDSFHRWPLLPAPARSSQKRDSQKLLCTIKSGKIESTDGIPLSGLSMEFIVPAGRFSMWPTDSMILRVLKKLAKHLVPKFAVRWHIKSATNEFMMLSVRAHEYMVFDTRLDEIRNAAIRPKYSTETLFYNYQHLEMAQYLIDHIERTSFSTEDLGRAGDLAGTHFGSARAIREHLISLLIGSFAGRSSRGIGDVRRIYGKHLEARLGDKVTGVEGVDFHFFERNMKSVAENFQKCGRR